MIKNSDNKKKKKREEGEEEHLSDLMADPVDEGEEVEDNGDRDIGGRWRWRVGCEDKVAEANDRGIEDEEEGGRQWRREGGARKEKVRLAWQPYRC